MRINSRFWQTLFFSTSSCQKLNQFSAEVIFWIGVYVWEEVFKACIQISIFLLEYTNSSLHQSDIQDFFCLPFKANALTSYSGLEYFLTLPLTASPDASTIKREEREMWNTQSLASSDLSTPWHTTQRAQANQVITHPAARHRNWALGPPKYR